ncbi:envelope stress response membrane protein PspC [Sphingomonas xanthus]|uniref:Envelope stress response membrane protein PspC n=1 Tax=Sphingomonas xanthus TaxID=2594473 RepID=A0A516IPC0_9SPHN|nr:envelope stress response membrane protein PspC [Sphingomonas xanthus]QDP18770.1 envelope stress response membrane protein PspC [Sphingomonas xanthus]
MIQPPSRTKFYLDKRHGKLMGVCSGIADYTGLDVTLVRIMFVSAVVMSGGSVLPIYFIAGFIADDKPRELALEDQRDEEHQRFWQGVRQSPARTARDIRSRMRNIDRRLADIESYVTTENRSLAREIEQLR